MVRKEQGVSLVETILVLAIAGVLASTVIFGRDSARTKLQFGQSMDQWVNVLSQASTESSGTVGNTNVTSATAGANAAGKHIFGKYVTLTNGSTRVTVDTVLSTTSSVSGAPQTEVISDVGGPDSYAVSMPWRVVPTTGSPVYILFVQNNVGITPQVYILPSPLTASTSQTALTGLLTTDFPIPMGDGSGNTGSITIDQSGNVTRTIN